MNSEPTLRTFRPAVLAFVCALLAATIPVGSPAPASAASTPTVSIGDASNVEGDTTARTVALAVTLSQPSSVPVTMTYTTSSATATGGTATTPNADFNDNRGRAKSLTFNAGVVVKYVVVTIYPDTVVEGDETINVALAGSPIGYTIDNADGTVAIIDDDPSSGVRIAVSDASIDEGDQTKRVAKFDVNLSQPATATVSVAYTIVGDTATGGYKSGSTPPIGTDIADFLGAPRTIVFTPTRTGSTPVKKTVSVMVYPDATGEPDETFHVVLGNPTGPATIADDTGIGTVVNDDGVATTTTVTSAANPASSATAIALTAEVAAADASVPTGTVTFTDGVTPLGTSPLIAGTASLDVAFAAGAHTIVASYSGDASHLPSASGPYDQQVLEATTTDLSTGIDPAVVDGALSFTISVSSATDTPTGIVTLDEGGFTYAFAPLVGGTLHLTDAQLSNVLPTGVHDLHAVYLGDATHAPSSSSVVVQTVNGPAPDSLWATGRVGPGMLGDGRVSDLFATIWAPRTRLEPVGTTADWSDLSAGDDHVLAVKTDGSLWAWGDDQDGELGGPLASAVPARVGTETDWAKVAAGYHFSVAVKADGTLWTWGSDDHGELGTGGTGTRDYPAQVGSATDWTEIAVGQGHVVALRADGSLWAWGNNGWGQLGTGTTTSIDAPVQVGTETDWTRLAAGGLNSAALKSDGTLWTWGRNEFGELGIGNTVNSDAPVQVGTDTDWTDVDIDQFTIAIKTDGSMWGWGWNFYGTVGNGAAGPSAVNPTTPVPVAAASGTGFRTVSVALRHALAVDLDGNLYAWGYNGEGQLGLGGTSDRSTPRLVGHAHNWSLLSASLANSFAIAG